MDSEDAARASAQQKHNKFMVFGKKYRYIEVFQCSGDDMNLVLNGGLHTPPNATKPSLLSPGMLPQTPQATQSSPSPGLPITIQPPLTLSLTQPAAASLLAQQQQAQQAHFIAHQNLFARQQAINAAAANVASAHAAAHAQSQSSVDQTQYYLPNMGLLQTAGAVQSAAQQHMHLSQMSGGHPSSHGSHTMPNHAQPPYQYLLRSGLHTHTLSPQMNQMSMGYLPFHHPLSLMHQNSMHSSLHAQQQSQSTMTPVSVAAAAAAAAAAATSLANTQQHQYQMPATVSMPTSMIQAASYKRSYESAFHDPASIAAANASATKRFLSRPAPNMYAPFFPPGL